MSPLSFQEGLEGDHGRDRVQQCRLLTSFQEDILSRNFFQNSASKMANCVIVDIVNYLMLLLANCVIVDIVNYLMLLLANS